MSIYCQKSLLKYAQQQKRKIFLFNKRCIRWYESFFGVKYPFSKADMVFCPEYTVGAMEFPGVVTYTNSYIYQ